MSTSDQTFEVRCERCNVSFPVGTKTCIHCGGRIDPHNTTETQIHLAGADAPAREARAARPIDVMADPFEPDTEGAEEPMSVGRTLIRSLGGLIWVIVLIGFTLARSCGGE
jgi:hypothetical protein